MRNKLINEFPTVLVDELPDSAGIKDAKMTIHLKPNMQIIPKKIYTARQIPAHFQAPAEKVVSDLVKAKRIVPVTEPTDWVNPAHFVAKPNGSVRLTVDLSYLNQYVDRPIHVFPSTKEIINALRPEYKIFAKLDAIHGYFQIPLDEPSSFMTTFLLPTGRYRSLYAPQGLSASSDEFCRSTDRYLGNIDNVFQACR